VDGSAAPPATVRGGEPVFPMTREAFDHLVATLAKLGFNPDFVYDTDVERDGKVVTVRRRIYLGAFVLNDDGAVVEDDFELEDASTELLAERLSESTGCLTLVTDGPFGVAEWLAEEVHEFGCEARTVPAHVVGVDSSKLVFLLVDWSYFPGGAIILRVDMREMEDPRLMPAEHVSSEG
jgi:hypothetical protein